MRTQNLPITPRNASGFFVVNPFCKPSSSPWHLPICYLSPISLVFSRLSSTRNIVLLCVWLLCCCYCCCWLDLFVCFNAIINRIFLNFILKLFAANKHLFLVCILTWSPMTLLNSLTSSSSYVASSGCPG